MPLPCPSKSKVRLPADPAEFTEIVKGTIEFARRRFRTRKGDLETFGYTTGCPVRRAVKRDTIATNHSEECR